eukprot:jgi/Hompol1/5522/HPOL_004491-RA
MPLVFGSTILMPGDVRYTAEQQKRNDILQLMDLTTSDPSSAHPDPSLAALGYNNHSSSSLHNPPSLHPRSTDSARSHTEYDDETDDYDDYDDRSSAVYDNDNTRYHRDPASRNSVSQMQDAVLQEGGIILNPWQVSQCLRLLRDAQLARKVGVEWHAAQIESDGFVQEELHAAYAVISDLTNSTTKQADTISTLSADIVAMRAKIARLEADLSEQEMVTQDLRDEHTMLVDLKEHAQDEKIRMKREIQQAQTSLAETNLRISEQDKYIAKLEEQLRQSASAQAPVQSVVLSSLSSSTASSSISAINGSSVAPEAAINSMGNAVDLTSARQMIENLQLQLQTSRDSEETMHRTLQETSAKLLAKQSECDQLTQIVAKLQAELEEANSRIVLAGVMDHGDNAASSLQSNGSADGLKRDVATIEAELSSKNALLTAITEQFEQTRKELEHMRAFTEVSKSKELSRLKMEMSVIERENAGYISKNASLQEIIESYREEIEQLTAQITELRTQYQRDLQSKSVEAVRLTAQG